jgi:hypothetical protein
MACSKFSTVTPCLSIFASSIDFPREIPKIKTRFGHGYTRTTEAFCISDIDGKTTFWLAQIFDTPNKKDVVETSNVYIWHVLTDAKIESFTRSPVPYSMGDGRVLSTIECPLAIQEMSELPKSLAACLYTTNSFASLSSMSRTHGGKDPSCLEFYFNVKAKSELALRQMAVKPAKAVFDYMQTTRFIDGDTLNDIVQNLGNDQRFHARAADSMSDDARKTFNDELLRHTRENIAKSGDHDDFQILVCAWIRRNLDLPKLFDPVKCKELVGRKLPLFDIALWNHSVGLLMIVIASKLYKESPVDLQLALAAGHGAWVAEFTTRDERYGCSIDKKMNLGEACKTPHGKIGLMKLLITEHARQETFIAELQDIIAGKGEDELARARAALTKLTKGIDEYGASIHGLCRAIVLRVMTEDIEFPPLLYNEIVGYFRENFGLNWDFHPTEVYETDDDSLDPFTLLHNAGEGIHPMREETVGSKRSLSAD